jgi:hypothetical protein
MNRFALSLPFTLFSLLLNVFCSHSQSVECHSNLTSISLLEEELKDISIPRTYILCPNTKFDAATVDSEGYFEKYPLYVRSNALVQCGADGSSQNACFIDGNGVNGIMIDP